MQDFRNLRVWQKAHDQVLAVYRCTRSFPKDETYGLRAQLRRAAVSIPANVAEGCGREYHLILAHDLDYLTAVVYRELMKTVVAVKRMISGLLKRTGARRIERAPARKYSRPVSGRKPTAENG